MLASICYAALGMVLHLFVSLLHLLGMTFVSGAGYIDWQCSLRFDLSTHGCSLEKRDGDGARTGQRPAFTGPAAPKYRFSAQRSTAFRHTATPQLRFLTTEHRRPFKLAAWLTTERPKLAGLSALRRPR
jgi:hypothetical protein